MSALHDSWSKTMAHDRIWPFCLALSILNLIMHWDLAIPFGIKISRMSHSALAFSQVHRDGGQHLLLVRRQMTRAAAAIQTLRHDLLKKAEESNRRRTRWCKVAYYNRCYWKHSQSAAVRQILMWQLSYGTIYSIPLMPYNVRWKNASVWSRYLSHLQRNNEFTMYITMAHCNRCTGAVWETVCFGGAGPWGEE